MVLGDSFNFLDNKIRQIVSDPSLTEVWIWLPEVEIAHPLLQDQDQIHIHPCKIMVWNDWSSSFVVKEF